MKTSKSYWLSLIVLLVAVILVTGCAQLPGLDQLAETSQPASSATIVLPTITFSPQVTATPPPQDTPIPTDLPTSIQTTTSAQPSQPQTTDEIIPQDVLNAVQTQYALMQTPATPTLCLGLSCPTSTRTPRPSPTPTLTPTSGIPLSYLQIHRPGQMSKVTSPINLEAMVIPGANGIVRIELLGENGRVILRDVERYGMPPGQRFGINPSLDFEIPGVAETARLQISVEDVFGRPIALSSVNLILLTMGDNEINPSNDLLDPFVIKEPRENTYIHGGEVKISGLARPLTDQPLILELIDQKGQVLGSRQVQLPDPTGPDGNVYTPFQATIPYQVSGDTPVRLVMRQQSTRIPGNVELSSILLTLSK